MPFLFAERARSEGARSMRAVKGNLGHSLNERYKGRAEGARRLSAGLCIIFTRLVFDVALMMNELNVAFDITKISLKAIKL